MFVKNNQLDTIHNTRNETNSRLLPKGIHTQSGLTDSHEIGDL